MRANGRLIRWFVSVEVIVNVLIGLIVTLLFSVDSFKSGRVNGYFDQTYCD